MEQKINFAWPVTSSSKEEYVAFCEWMTAHKTMLESNEIAIWGAEFEELNFRCFLNEQTIQKFFL